MIAEDEIKQLGAEAQKAIRNEIEKLVANGYARRHLLLLSSGDVHLDADAQQDEIFAIGMKIDHYDENLSSEKREEIWHQIEDHLSAGCDLDKLVILADGTVR